MPKNDRLSLTDEFGTLESVFSSAVVTARPAYVASYGRLILGATLLAFGGSFLIASGENTATTTFFRCLLALPILAAMAIPEIRRFGRLSRRATVLYLAGGAFLGVDFALWAHAVSSVGVGIATIATNVHILIAPALAAMVGRGRLGASYFWTVPVMLIGVAMAGNLFGAAPSTTSVMGLVFGVVAGIGYGGFVFVNGAVPQTRHFATPALLTTIACGVAGVSVGVLFGPVNFYPETSSLGWMLCLAVCNQVLALLLIGPSLARVSAAVGASLLLLTPVLALILGVVLFGEPLTAIQLGGVVLVIGGVFAATVIAPVGVTNGRAAAGERAPLAA